MVRLCPNLIGNLIPGSNCLRWMWVVLVCMEGGHGYPCGYLGGAKCIKHGPGLSPETMAFLFEPAE